MFDDDIMIGLAAALAGIALAQFLTRRDLRASGQRTGWVTAASLVLVIAGGLYLLHPPGAGLAALAALLALLFVPGMAGHAVEAALRAGHYRRAWLACLVAALLHPTRLGWRQLRVIAALLPVLRGDLAAAAAALRPLIGQSGQPLSPERAFARMHLARLTGEWGPLAGWPPNPATDAARLRALAELGDRAGLLDGYAAALAALPPGASPPPMLSLMALAFCGRAPAVAHLLAGPLADLPRDAARYWLATARLAGGERAGGVRMLSELAAHGRGADLRAAAGRRLLWSPMSSPPAAPFPEAAAQPATGPSDREHAAILAAAAARAFAAPPSAAASPIVTRLLIALNVAVFALETWRGGSSDSDVLYDLGGLWPQDVFGGGQPWRLATALFLHAGVAHIVFNMLALAVFGGPMERRLGPARFAVLYLGAGLASMLTVTLLTIWGIETPDLLVGASGAIMGLIGGAAALFLRRAVTPTPGPDRAQARAGLRQMATLIVLQSAIDLAVPQISMTGHLAGAAAGLLIGLILPLPQGSARLRALLSD